MSDLISRQEAIDALAEHEKSRGHNYTFFVDIVSECAEIIRNLPSAQSDRGKGMWFRIGNTGLATCKCGYMTDRYSVYNFCPNCGADMRGEKDE